MNCFYPFMQSTQRSEGFNAVLKRYVHPQNSIFDFVRQYSMIQDKIMNAENKQEAESAITTTETWCGHPIEQQMVQVYTRQIYFRFQAEMRLSMSYSCQCLPNCTYLMTSLVGYINGYGARAYKVVADIPAWLYSCECSKFDRDGILCCHILRVCFFTLLSSSYSYCDTKKFKKLSRY